MQTVFTDESDKSDKKPRNRRRLCSDNPVKVKVKTKDGKFDKKKASYCCCFKKKCR